MTRIQSIRGQTCYLEPIELHDLKQTLPWVARGICYIPLYRLGEGQSVPRLSR